MVSFLLVLVPTGLQLIYLWTTFDNTPIVRNAEMDMSQKERFNFRNRFIYGDVDFFYNEWLYTDRSTDAKPISFTTPSPWTGHLDAEGNPLPSEGYATYRFRIRGLTPGTRIRAFGNIDLPNRIFLNGVLCSQTGEPSKSSQSSFFSVSTLVDESIIVPEDGVVEYGMEVGNTGDGGCHHIGAFYVDGQNLRVPTQYYFFPIAMGFLGAGVVIAVALVLISPFKMRLLLILAAMLFEAALYICSADSFIISAGLMFSAPAAEILMVAAFGIICLLVAFYGYFGRFNPFNEIEATSLAAVTAISIFGYCFTHGMEWNWVFIALLASVPAYGLIKTYAARVKGFMDVPFMAMNTLMLAHCLLIWGYSLDGYGVSFIFHPTLHVVIATALFFSTAFYDTYVNALARKDIAVLFHRYQTISNRALARISSEHETIRSLDLIAESYDRSVEEGEKYLLSFSSLIRERLYALRQEKIPLLTECELEGKISKFMGDLHGYSTSLVFDVELGEILIPPLIFEEAIAELAPFIGDEPIFIVEGKNTVSFVYPEGFELNHSTVLSITERCALQGLLVQVRANEIIISEKVFQ